MYDVSEDKTLGLKWLHVAKNILLEPQHVRPSMFSSGTL